MLANFDTDFALIGRALASGEFALWVGSGISRRAPNLGHLIERALEYLRERAVDPVTETIYRPALDQALEITELDLATLAIDFHVPVAAWPKREAIVGALWSRYSRLLDIRVLGEPADFMLWTAIDIRAAFAHPAAPAAEHLCIAMLVLEGAVRNIASANWDGFIEAATTRLSGGAPGILQVVVDPDNLRGAAGRARLLKFHGCVVYATADQDAFRLYLTGSHTQIMLWPEDARYAAMRHSMVEVIANQKSLVLGLSIQDNNLQTLFARAKQINPWPWPCAPAAPAHVFCEDRIKPGQRDVLKIVYGDAYNNNAPAIDAAAHLRSWGEQVLIALVLKIVTDKLLRLMSLCLAEIGKAALAGDLVPALTRVRNTVADLAGSDPVDASRTAAVNAGIALWSRLLRLFRHGALQPDSLTYEPVSASPPDMLEADPNVQASGLGRLAVALALLEHGRTSGQWTLSAPANGNLPSGALSAVSARPGASPRPIFVVRSASEAIALRRDGAFANDDAVVVHADDVWQQLGGLAGSSRQPRSAPGRTGRVSVRHVSLGWLLANCDTAAALRQRFAEEMMV